MSSQKGLNKIQTSGGVVYDLAGKTIDGNTIADLTDLASTANGKGAARIGIEDTASKIVATNVEGALAENRALIDQHSLGLGAFWMCVDTVATSNITLSGEQTIADLATSTSRVLVIGQTDATENGIYVTAAGAWSRASDADASNEFSANKTVCAEYGSNAGKTYAYTGDTEPTLGSDDLDFVMKSGTNIADSSVTNAKLASDSVTTAKILDANVTSAKIASDAIDGSKIADDSIDSEHLVADSIDTEHYAPSSIDTTAIQVGAITGSRIANDAVDSQHLAADSIDSEHYASGSVDNTALGADCVDGSKIADDALGSEHYSAGSVDNTALGSDSIDGSKVQDDAIDSEHLATDSVTSDAIAADSVTGSELHEDAENDRMYVTTINYDSGASNTLIANAPSGSHILQVMVKVTTAFDGTAPTLSLGVSGSTSAIAATTDFDLTTTSENPQMFDGWYTMQSTTDVLGTLTVSGATAGSCLVAVRRVKS